MSLKSIIPSLRHSETGGSDLFRNLQTEVDRLFDEYKDFTPFTGVPAVKRQMEFTNPVPKVDFSETDTAIEIEAEMPGVERKDVDITLNGQLLSIQGKKETEKKSEEKNYRFVERSTGSFQRVIPLGFDADADKIEAKFEDGVLTVTVLKPEEAVANVKKIEVSESSK